MSPTLTGTTMDFYKLKDQYQECGKECEREVGNYGKESSAKKARSEEKGFRRGGEEFGRAEVSLKTVWNLDS